MEKLVIGNVLMMYDEEGNVINAIFDPTMKLDFKEPLSDQLQQIKCSEDVTTVQQNADTIFAGWFSKLNEIELADRTKYEIKSNVLDCEKYPNGKVKKCLIQYVYQEIKN